MSIYYKRKRGVERGPGPGAQRHHVIDSLDLSQRSGQQECQEGKRLACGIGEQKVTVRLAPAQL